MKVDIILEAKSAHIKLLHSLLLGIGLVTLFIGCTSDSNLSRSKAKDLLSQHPTFAAPVKEIRIGLKGFNTGCNEKLWDCQWGAISPKGAEFVTSWRGPGVVVLRQQAKREVAEVTGITDDAEIGQGKVVEFTWKYTGIPAGFARHVGAGATTPEKSKAWFKLYDDGWRLETLNVNVE
jgi:hypothetical protein